ncbi:MAG: hypothetical protein WCD45_04030 [Gallionella sp.]
MKQTFSKIMLAAALFLVLAQIAHAVQYTPTPYNPATATAVYAPNPYADAAGTADAITASYPNAPTPLIDGYSLTFGASAVNTTSAPTFAPTLSGAAQTARNIVKFWGNLEVPVVAGDIQGVVEVVYDLPNLKWIITNPAQPFNVASGVLQVGTIASGTGTLSVSSVLNVPAGTSGAPSITFGGSATTGFYSSSPGLIITPGSLIANGSLYTTTIRAANGALISVGTNPTITGGLGTAPSIVANGSMAFTITVGTGGTASSGVISMGGAAAATGWNCIVTPAGAPQAGAVTYAASTSTTSITVTNYTQSTGVALAWTAGQVLNFHCLGR